METFTLSQKTLQGIVDYLVLQPYKDVAVLINAIQADISSNKATNKEDTNKTTSKEDNRPLDCEYL